MRRFALWLLLAALLPGAAAQAQTAEAAGVPAGRECRLSVDPGGLTSREGNLLNIFDPFRVLCNDGANLRANSGVFDQAARVVTLTGDVYFEDQTRTLTSDRAVYNNLIGMLHATGNVVFTDRVEGTTLVGPELEYYRVNEQRPEALVNAYGRPRLTLRALPGAEDEATAAAADTARSPLAIHADQMTIEGRDDLTAVGNVVIEGDNLRAVSDEAEQRGASETLELRGNAQIHSREYSLAANTIFATIPEGSIREVEARGSARLLGEDLNVQAPLLDLVFEEDLLQRSIARGDEALEPGVRPIAASPTFRLEADSIDASLPGQRLETVVAIGNARGETLDTTSVAPVGAPDGAVVDDDRTTVPADSALVGGAEAVASGTPGGVAPRFQGGDSIATVSAARLVENDWISGDTITGYFTSVFAEAAEPGPADPMENGDPVELDGEVAVDGAGADTTLVMERLVAVGSARSLYRVAPEPGSPPGTRSGVNFLSAAHIELQFEDGRVQVADVSGLRRGLYLEPLAAAASPAGDGAPQGETEGDGEVGGEVVGEEDAGGDAGSAIPPAENPGEENG